MSEVTRCLKIMESIGFAVKKKDFANNVDKKELRRQYVYQLNDFAHDNIFEKVQDNESFRVSVKKYDYLDLLADMAAMNDETFSDLFKASFKIAYVKVHLDNEVPEDMQGILRCGSVISEDYEGNEIMDHQELIDNTEYHSREDLISEVAFRLNVSPNIVEIIR